jgi:acyl-CoA reductase-like NAD-dependent aldehyde dehydrogenase
MFEYWEQEPSEAEVEELIEKAAKEIRRRRMETPAILAIEMHKPLANIGAHAAIAFAPFLAPFFGADKVGAYSAIFRERKNLDRLLDKLAAPVEDVAISEKT